LGENARGTPKKNKQKGGGGGRLEKGGKEGGACRKKARRKFARGNKDLVLKTLIGKRARSFEF